MGVLNITPDSFSDGGRFFDEDRAVERALEIERQGADVIDLGGESTRPGSKRTALEVELKRLIPVLKKIRRRISIPISIDTYKSPVAVAALEEGAEIINDVSAGRWDPAMFETVRRFRAGMILMHMRGEPRMWGNLKPRRAVVQSTRNELYRFCQKALAAGIPPQRLVIDPGIGFGKNPMENMKLLARLPVLGELGFPICVGTSRKSFLGAVVDRPVEDRLMGTAASVAVAIWNGAHVVRVHDVKEMVEVARVVDAANSVKILPSHDKRPH
ncbi:MAG: dihydropteroate synthase [Acidobacteriia bacterium]|nr:dihydropteroate synthase [Terriglobia bacterium]